MKVYGQEVCIFVGIHDMNILIINNFDGEQENPLDVFIKANKYFD